MRVSSGIHLGRSLLLSIGTMNSVKKTKGLLELMGWFDRHADPTDGLLVTACYGDWMVRCARLVPWILPR
jgi:hypothetical protein